MSVLILLLIPECLSWCYSLSNIPSLSLILFVTQGYCTSLLYLSHVFVLNVSVVFCVRNKLPGFLGCCWDEISKRPCQVEFFRVRICSFSLMYVKELLFLRSLPCRWDFESSGITRTVLTSQVSCCTSWEAVGVLRKVSGVFCALGSWALLGALCWCSELLPSWVAWRVSVSICKVLKNSAGLKEN